MRAWFAPNGGGDSNSQKWKRFSNLVNREETAPLKRARQRGSGFGLQ